MAEAKDGSKPLYGGLIYLSETANSITIRIPANSVLATTLNLPILLQLNPRTLDNGTTIEKIFTELTANWDKLYVKDSSVNQELKVDTWEYTMNTARVWVILDELTTAQTDLVIEFDSTSAVNPLSEFIAVNDEE